MALILHAIIRIYPPVFLLALVRRLNYTESSFFLISALHTVKYYLSHVLTNNPSELWSMVVTQVVMMTAGKDTQLGGSYLLDDEDEVVWWVVAR